MCVIPCRAMYSCRTSPPTASDGRYTRTLPDRVAIRYSRTDASKLGEAKPRTREYRSTPARSISSAAKLARPEWVTDTPLGRPVDPDV